LRQPCRSHHPEVVACVLGVAVGEGDDDADGLIERNPLGQTVGHHVAYPGGAARMTEKAFVRFTPSLGKALDKWRRAQMDTPSRANAIRRLFGKALKDEGYALSTTDAEGETKKPAKKTGK
jgi:hypothetical protein